MHSLIHSTLSVIHCIAASFGPSQTMYQFLLVDTDAPRGSTFMTRRVSRAKQIASGRRDDLYIHCGTARGWYMGAGAVHPE